MEEVEDAPSQLTSAKEAVAAEIDISVTLGVEDGVLRTS